MRLDKNVSVSGHQFASPANQANAPYGDKGVDIQILAESKISLAGRTCSRKFMGRPLGSPNEVEFEHSVRFNEDETVTDNANSFFGNPPATNKFKIAKGSVVIDLGDGETETYRLSKDLKTLTNEAGAVLTINKN